MDEDDVDLREMLGTSPARKTGCTFMGGWPGPPWTDYFRIFVKDELDYDGIIYIEGGEGKRAKDHVTFVVYNLEYIHFSKNQIKDGSSTESD